MNSSEFRKAFAEATRLIIEYKQNVGKYKVWSNPENYAIMDAFDEEAPEKKIDFSEIIAQLKSIVIPNLTHWGHPQFYAYFPCGSAYPSQLAELLINGLGLVGANYEMCPGLTELEILTCDLMGKFMNLPHGLLYDESNGIGGGILTNSASEAAYYTMLVARNRTLDRITPVGEHLMRYIHKLTLYVSEDAHSCIEKAGNLLQVITRKIAATPDNGFQVRPEDIRNEIEKDLALGLIPFYVAGTIGTTGAAGIDNMTSLQEIKKDYPDLWFHVDGAYGGSALTLRDLAYLLPGLESVDSMNTNPYKWMLTALDGSALWVRDRKTFQKYYRSDRKTFTTIDENLNFTPDLPDITFTFTRRLRSLRLYMTLRIYGKKGIRDYIRNSMRLAKYIGRKIQNHPHLVLVNRVQLALVCFRVKDIGRFSSKDLTLQLAHLLNEDGKVHITQSDWRKVLYYIRISINYEYATQEIVDKGWQIITDEIDELVKNPEEKMRRLKTRDGDLKDSEKDERSHASNLSNENLVSREQEKFMETSHTGSIPDLIDDSD